MLGVTRGRAKRPVQPPAGLFLGKGHNKPPNSQFPSVWAPSRAHPGVVLFFGVSQNRSEAGGGRQRRRWGPQKPTHQMTSSKHRPSSSSMSPAERGGAFRGGCGTGGLRHGGVVARGGCPSRCGTYLGARGAAHPARAHHEIPAHDRIRSGAAGPLGFSLPEHKRQRYFGWVLVVFGAGGKAPAPPRRPRRLLV